jgi:hypothetical protein
MSRINKSMPVLIGNLVCTAGLTSGYISPHYSSVVPTSEYSGYNPYYACNTSNLSNSPYANYHASNAGYANCIPPANSASSYSSMLPSSAAASSSVNGVAGADGMKQKDDVGWVPALNYTFTPMHSHTYSRRGTLFARTALLMRIFSLHAWLWPRDFHLLELQ